jgi:hypothetical protein
MCYRPFPPSPFTASFTTCAGPKMASHDLRTGSFKDGCLCSIITWASSTTDMGALPPPRFPFPFRTVLASHTSSHTAVVPFPGSTKGSSSTFTLLVLLQDCFSALSSVFWIWPPPPQLPHCRCKSSNVPPRAGGQVAPIIFGRNTNMLGPGRKPAHIRKVEHYRWRLPSRTIPSQIGPFPVLRQ